jgi:hypothetical protein
MNLKFDGGEYNNFVSIYQLSEFNRLHECKDLYHIKDLVDHQYIYSSNRVWRNQIKNSVSELKSMVDEAYNRDTISGIYCIIKFQTISDATMKIIKSIGELQ